MILEFVSSDLEKLIKAPSLRFSPSDVKSWLLMALRAVDYCHVNFLLHRDIKPNNMLIGSNGILKLADFGFARMYDDYNTPMTPRAVTLWYRAPELLLGASYYGTGIDIWALGCVFAELMLRVPYFAAQGEIEQLMKIFEALGTPTEKDWPVRVLALLSFFLSFLLCLFLLSSFSVSCSLPLPLLRSSLFRFFIPPTHLHLQGLTELSQGTQFKQYQRTPLQTLFTAASEDTLDLLAGMLAYDPNKRPTAKDALRHQYFVNAPRPTAPENLPNIPSESEGAKAIKREVVEEEETTSTIKGKRLKFENAEAK